MKKFILWITTILLCSTLLNAQQSNSSSNSADMAALQQQIKDLQERVISLEGQVRMLKSTQLGPAAAQPAAAPAEATTQPEAAPQAAPEVAAAPVQTAVAQEERQQRR